MSDTEGPLAISLALIVLILKVIYGIIGVILQSIDTSADEEKLVNAIVGLIHATHRAQVQAQGDTSAETE